MSKLYVFFWLRTLGYQFWKFSTQIQPRILSLKYEQHVAEHYFYNQKPILRSSTHFKGILIRLLGFISWHTPGRVASSNFEYINIWACCVCDFCLTNWNMSATDSSATQLALAEFEGRYCWIYLHRFLRAGPKVFGLRLTRNGMVRSNQP